MFVTNPACLGAHDPVLRERRWECARCGVPAQPGWVYAFEGAPKPRLLYTKIGRATNVENRLQDVQHACPFSLYIVAAIRVPDCIAYEHSLHVDFAPYRQRGEWFRLPPSEREKLYERLGGLRLALSGEPHDHP